MCDSTKIQTALEQCYLLIDENAVGERGASLELVPSILLYYASKDVLSGSYLKPEQPYFRIGQMFGKIKERDKEDIQKLFEQVIIAINTNVEYKIQYPQEKVHICSFDSETEWAIIMKTICSYLNIEC